MVVYILIAQIKQLQLIELKIIKERAKSVNI